MPTIDVTAPDDLFPPNVHRQLAADLTAALLRAEGAPLAAPFLENTAAYLHLMPADVVHTAGTAGAHTVRIQGVAGRALDAAALAAVSQP